MKYVLFSDIHFGNKGNSDEFNQQCLNFLDFVEQDTENKDVDGAIFCGDWFHTRNNVNVKTLKYGIEGLYKLGNIGRGNSYFILGNHDLYWKNSRDIHSIIIPEGDIGVNLITEPLMVDNILMCPWLINEEKVYELIQKFNPTYICGHFEIPSFPLNRLSTFDGEYNPEDYKGPKRIISGHFHMRSEKNNITYLGNCFSHDFSDVNDWNNKGYAIWNTDTNEIEYFEWKDGPKYCTVKVSKLNEMQLGNNLHLKIINDTGLTPLQAAELKEEILKLDNVVDCMVYPAELTITVQDSDDEIETISNINHLIYEMLIKMDMTNIDSSKLAKIYISLEV